MAAAGGALTGAFARIRSSAWPALFAFCVAPLVAADLILLGTARDELGDHETRFDGLTQSDLVGQQRTTPERPSEPEHRSLDLMRM